MLDSLAALLDLPDEEKLRRGLTDTPREIQQQPETWRGTMRHLEADHVSIVSFLAECGGLRPARMDGPGRDSCWGRHV